MYYYTADEISYASFGEFSSYSGNLPLSLSPITDTTINIWSGQLSLPVGSIHTFFLTGTDSLHVDTLFTTDLVPYYSQNGDSVAGFRFINLSAGSNPISIDLQNTPANTLIVNSLAYKGVTAFIQEPSNANAMNNGYVFEIRDAASSTILTTIPINSGTYPVLFPYKNVTICLIGQPGVNAIVPQSALAYPNY